MVKGKAIICDLDGTLAILEGRGPFEYERCDTDLPSEAVVELLRAMGAAGHTVIFVSGREDSCREKTVSWINRLSLPSEKLFMRKTGDFRKDVIVKREIYEKEIKEHYNVCFVLEDRNQAVRMWRSLGLPCFQVAEGDF
ncbi:phosphatase domain-containing protein [Nitrolancea hollandica]|uniref:Polynucleotide kinase n=1 Tax=Nitrolancea hollandica Lb TaxID=1129897 RepID=I4ECG8_9BACT